MSGETKWTPGPWGGKGGVALGEDGRAHVLLGHTSEAVVCAPTSVVALANARLIAAAPRLYEALEKLAADVGFNCSHDAYQSARAALAAARGETKEGP